MCGGGDDAAVGPSSCRQLMLAIAVGRAVQWPRACEHPCHTFFRPRADLRHRLGRVHEHRPVRNGEDLEVPKWHAILPQVGPRVLLDCRDNLVYGGPGAPFGQRRVGGGVHRGGRRQFDPDMQQ